MKTISANHDLLGIVAIGSIIGNLAQAKEMAVVKKQSNILTGMYHKLVEHYKMLYREYEAFRQVNEQLRVEVVSLRIENSSLLGKIAAKGSAR
jgi:translation initiation factor 6 (eIF-6)